MQTYRIILYSTRRPNHLSSEQPYACTLRNWRAIEAKATWVPNRCRASSSTRQVHLHPYPNTFGTCTPLKISEEYLAHVIFCSAQESKYFCILTGSVVASLIFSRQCLVDLIRTRDRNKSPWCPVTRRSDVLVLAL